MATSISTYYLKAAKNIHLLFNIAIFFVFVNCWSARDVTVGHVGGQEQKHLSPLVAKLYFHLNSSRKILLYCPPTWPPCHVVANQE